jgi:putative SOS response-associated peptidase YedK
LPGRFFVTATVAELARHFDAEAAAVADPGPRPDAAPGGMVLAVVADPGRRLVAMRWGLMPMGRTDARGRPVMETIHNARAETLFEQRAFAGLRRALVPVVGWSEWTGERLRRTRWAIRAPGVPVLAVAAVWDLWRAPGGAEVASLATVTCAPNADVAPVHDRMPVILGPEAWPVWLGEAEGDAAGLLRPLPDGALVAEAAEERRPRGA